MIDAPQRAAMTPPADSLDAARAALADEWRAANPTTPDEIAAFYRDAQGYGADLDAWHALPERQSVTGMLVHVAKESGARLIADIGCGAGHDLIALRDAFPESLDTSDPAYVELWGFDPNERLLLDIPTTIDISTGIEWPVIERTDLLICVDVLEHIPDPETFLAGIATRARVGCLLFESTASHDTHTPLHLPANRGWHPGRCLERHGWACVDRALSGRVRVWRRVDDTGHERASLLLCAHRSVNAETMSAILHVCAGENEAGWRLRTKTGDALIARSRAIAVTGWWRETADDVFLMIDDDIVFAPTDADRLADLCRSGHDIICGAYPVHDGGHLACRFLPGTGTVAFGPDHEPIEIEYAATGCMAVHRRVIDALIAPLPLCHADQPWSFYPLFMPRIITHAGTGDAEMLSEDWAFAHTAREAGFAVWLDPQTRLTHLGTAGISVANMAAMHQALKGV